MKKNTQDMSWAIMLKFFNTYALDEVMLDLCRTETQNMVTVVLRFF
ncbi:MAG: hypothetical protein M9899_00230 [Bdellovibrionaceae bacterium]|nr:hypothetical protein [Pseudobdellovibrionaceae bacterium]